VISRYPHQSKTIFIILLGITTEQTASPPHHRTIYFVLSLPAEGGRRIEWKEREMEGACQSRKCMYKKK
jgi:hypothetical protein